MRNTSPNKKEKQPGFLSLLIFALFILGSWQISAWILNTNGPLDVFGKWVLPNDSIVFGTVHLMIIVILTLLSLLTTYFALQGWTHWKWKSMLQRLSSFITFKEERLLESLPIQGVEIASLPLFQQFQSSTRWNGDFSGPSIYGPYRYAHWVALHGELEEVMFEVDIGVTISIRFWVPKKAKKYDALQVLCSSLQASYGNLEFTNIAYTAIPAIFSSSNSNARLSSNLVKFDNICVSVILIEGIPEISLGDTMLDRLIQAFTEREIQASLIVNFSPIKRTSKPLFGKTQDKIVKHDRRWDSPTKFSQNVISNNDGHGLRFWKASAYLVIRSEDEKFHNEKVRSAKIILETTFLNPNHPINTKILKGQALRRALGKVLHRKKIGKTDVVSSRQLSMLVHLPQQAQPGFLRKHTANFEIPPQRESDITLFNVMRGNHVLYPIGIDLSHFTTHMMIAGQTGRGKTYFVANLLEQIQKFPNVGITVFDWKGEYHRLVRTVYRVGSQTCPLRINLFETHGLVNVEEYVQNLVALLRELLRTGVENNLSTQMERIFRDSLIEYLKRGSGNYEEYELFLSEWIKKNKHQFSNPESSLAGLVNRFGSLFRGKLGRIFNTTVTTIDFNTLLSDHVCFDLSSLAAYNKDDARLFLNTILMVIRTYLFQRFSKKLRYLVIAEEAQYLVPEIFTKRSTADASPVEDITLFQRAYGAGLIAITTRPNLISRNILANSGTKIFFQCPLDSNLVGDILNLNIEQRQYLSLMPEQVLIAHLPWFEHPFKAQTIKFQFPHLKERESTLFSRISTDQPIFPFAKSQENNEHMQLQRKTITPVIGHFLDLVCLELYKQDILHRVIRIKDHTAIDIPRHSVLALFFEKANLLRKLDFQDIRRLGVTIVIFHPPRLKTRFRRELDKRKNSHLDHADQVILVIPLTRSEIRKLIKFIKMGQLRTIPFCTTDNQEKSVELSIEKIPRTDDTFVGQLVNCWRQIEWLFKKALNLLGMQSNNKSSPQYQMILRLLGLSHHMKEFEWLRYIRNQVLHNVRPVDKGLASNYCKRSQDLLDVISKSIDKEIIPKY